MSKHGKKYREARALIEENKKYPIDEAIELLKKTITAKFDSSCEIHVRLGVDTSKADQLVRGTVALPHGTGKKLRVIAFVADDKVKEAKNAGAIEAGSAELIEKIIGGWLGFDTAVATPDMMKGLGKIAKTLGQKGLMPNPKAGTVTLDVAKTISEIMKGKVEFRLDKEGNLHNTFGKASFDNSKLKENLQALLKAIIESKPSGAKGTYILNVTLATTMGPGIKLDFQSATQKE